MHLKHAYVEVTPHGPTASCRIAAAAPAADQSACRTGGALALLAAWLLGATFANTNGSTHSGTHM